MSNDREGVPVSVAWILLAALGAAILLTNLMRSPDASTERGFPATANGLPVVTVPDAIEVRQLGADTDVAVSGWFQHPAAIECPAPRLPIVPLLDGDCAIDFTWLMADEESLIRISLQSLDARSPLGPAVHPVLDGPGTDWVRPLPQERSPDPLRATSWAADSRRSALRRFVGQAPVGNR